MRLFIIYTKSWTEALFFTCERLYIGYFFCFWKFNTWVTGGGGCVGPYHSLSYISPLSIFWPVLLSQFFDQLSPSAGIRFFWHTHTHTQMNQPVVFSLISILGVFEKIWPLKSHGNKKNSKFDFNNVNVFMLSYDDPKFIENRTVKCVGFFSFKFFCQN